VSQVSNILDTLKSIRKHNEKKSQSSYDRTGLLCGSINGKMERHRFIMCLVTVGLPMSKPILIGEGSCASNFTHAKTNLIATLIFVKIC